MTLLVWITSHRFDTCKARRWVNAIMFSFAHLSILGLSPLNSRCRLLITLLPNVAEKIIASTK